MQPIKISEIKKVLADAARLPPAEAVATTGRAAVEACRDEVLALRLKGFSARQILEILSGAGVTLSLASLATYMRLRRKTADVFASKPQPADTQMMQSFADETPEEIY